MDRPAARAGVRWGLPDVLLAWIGGLGASIFSVAFYDPDKGAARQPTSFYISGIVLQSVGVVVVLLLIARAKGRGTLRTDFGFVDPFRVLDPMRAFAWLGFGIGLSILANVILEPIADLADLRGRPAQDISKAVERSGGGQLALLAVCVAVLAPVIEELLFRGALLRALQRRFAAPVAIFGSGLVFALVHVIGDLGAGYVVPGLLLLGLVSGYVAVRTGDLARSILLHVGFNLVATVLLIT